MPQEERSRIELAKKWLSDHEHYVDDPCYVNDLADLVELLDLVYARAIRDTGK